MSIHATSTKVYSGAQMLTKNGMATPSTDTSFWASFSNLTQVDNGNGWATFTRNITSNYSNIQTTTTSVDLVGNSTYTAIVEIQNCSINSGYIIFAQTSAASDAVSAFTVVNGCDYTPSTYFMGVSLNGNSTSKYNVYTFTTKSSFTRGLRYFIDTGTGAGSLDIRATILTGDHSSDWQDYCGDNYEPYVGTTPSPLVKGVAHVSTSKNLLNMQSGSNGEYLGTTSQQRYSGKNLINASSSFTVTNSNVYRSIPVSISNGTTVCVQCDSITTNSTTGCSVRFQDANLAGVGTVILYPGTTLSQSVTLIGDAAYCYVYSSNNYASSQSATTTYTNLMVSTGSTAQPYEPYVGGVPSPNPDYPQEIVTGKLASKNLCPDITEGYYVTSTSTGWGKTAVDSGVLISVEPNTNYTISTTATQSRYRFCFVASLDDSNGYNGGANDGGSNTYTKNSGSYPYLIVNATDLSKIQVEKGSRATTFEPYFTPIELAKIGSYQDTVYKSGNTWYLHKEINNIKLSSDTGFILYTGVSDAGFTFFRATVTTSKDRQCMSNYFDTSLEGWDNLQNVHVEMAQVYTNNFLYLKTKTSRIASTSDLETWLSNRDVHVYYILATSTDTAITDQTTINWLNNNDTDGAPHHKYINTRRTTYVGASGLASAIDLYDGSYASTLPTYTTANDHHLTTANGGTYTVSLQNISASIISGTVTFSVFTNQRKIDFSWNGSATSTSVSISLQANEYIKSIYAYIPQDADAGITLSQQLESGSLTDFEPYYNIVKIYAGDDLVFEDTSLTD